MYIIQVRTNFERNLRCQFVKHVYSSVFIFSHVEQKKLCMFFPEKYLTPLTSASVRLPSPSLTVTVCCTRTSSCCRSSKNPAHCTWSTPFKSDSSAEQPRQSHATCAVCSRSAICALTRPCQTRALVLCVFVLFVFSLSDTANPFSQKNPAWPHGLLHRMYVLVFCLCALFGIGLCQFFLCVTFFLVCVFV